MILAYLFFYYLNIYNTWQNKQRIHKQKHDHVTYRSSRTEVFYMKGVIKYFAKFIGKHLCQSVILNKVASY